MRRASSFDAAKASAITWLVTLPRNMKDVRSRFPAKAADDDHAFLADNARARHNRFLSLAAPTQRFTANRRRVTCDLRQSCAKLDGALHGGMHGS